MFGLNKPVRMNRLGKNIFSNNTVASPFAALKSYSAIIVTGGSSGIGKSFVQLCDRLNGGLVFCNLSRRHPGAIIQEKRLNHFACDVSRPAEIEHAAAGVVELLAREAPAGRVLLINNSGFGSYGRFPEPNLGHQLEMLDVNIRGLVHLTGLLLPLLKARGGAIINVASTAAFQPTPYMAAYGASKAFVLHWSLALNEELRGSGVRALAVCPGPTATNFFERAGVPAESVSQNLSQTCDEVVTASLEALAAGRAQVVSGWFNKILVGTSSKLPKPMAARLAEKVLNRYRLKALKR